MRLARDTHYVICLDFKFHKLYIVWIDGQDGEDTVLVNDELKIITFKTEAELLSYWQKYIKEQNRQPTTYSIYKLKQWLHNPHHKFDRDEFLNLWNLFIDVSESIKMQFIGDIKGDIRDSVYNKLFDASGLFIIDNPDPTFDVNEVVVLSKIMQNGLDILLNSLVTTENEKILP